MPQAAFGGVPHSLTCQIQSHHRKTFSEASSGASPQTSIDCELDGAFFFLAGVVEGGHFAFRANLRQCPAASSLDGVDCGHCAPQANLRQCPAVPSPMPPLATAQSCQGNYFGGETGASSATSDVKVS